MLGLRHHAERRILNNAWARTGEILSTVASWATPRREATRRLVADALARRLMEVEGGTKTLMHAVAELQHRVDELGPSLPATSAAVTDELVLNFLLALKLSREGRMRPTCEQIFQAIHRFANG